MSEIIQRMLRRNIKRFHQAEHVMAELSSGDILKIKKYDLAVAEYAAFLVLESGKEVIPHTALVGYLPDGIAGASVEHQVQLGFMQSHAEGFVFKEKSIQQLLAARYIAVCLLVLSGCKLGSNGLNDYLDDSQPNMRRVLWFLLKPDFAAVRDLVKGLLQLDYEKTGIQGFSPSQLMTDTKLCQSLLRESHSFVGTNLFKQGKASNHSSYTASEINALLQNLASDDVIYYHIQPMFWPDGKTIGVALIKMKADVEVRLKQQPQVRVIMPLIAPNGEKSLFCFTFKAGEIDEPNIRSFSLRVYIKNASGYGVTESVRCFCWALEFYFASVGKTSIKKGYQDGSAWVVEVARMFIANGRMPNPRSDIKSAENKHRTELKALAETEATDEAASAGGGGVKGDEDSASTLRSAR